MIILKDVDRHLQNYGNMTNIEDQCLTVVQVRYIFIFLRNMFSFQAEYGVRSTAKLLISNLDFGVVDQDLKELFGQFGPMTECRVLYERSGRSTGTAEIHFQRVADAKRARQEYNNVPLDGRDMVSKREPCMAKIIQYNMNFHFRILCSWADDKNYNFCFLICQICLFQNAFISNYVSSIRKLLFKNVHVVQEDTATITRATIASFISQFCS